MQTLIISFSLKSAVTLNLLALLASPITQPPAPLFPCTSANYPPSCTTQCNLISLTIATISLNFIILCPQPQRSLPPSRALSTVELTTTT